ncbi:hypothetical protein F5884DRAFT_758694 [Xylogone sp. PMI_703]|nr:hypothetical protein F5884DRAFT_758694 [Xylogone sp. PMI_703]
MGRGYSVKKCQMCRYRRLKCDGIEPICMRCTQAGIKCGGYGLVARFMLETGRASSNSGRDREVKKTQPSARPHHLLNLHGDPQLPLMAENVLAIYLPLPATPLLNMSSPCPSPPFMSWTPNFQMEASSTHRCARRSGNSRPSLDKTGILQNARLAIFLATCGNDLNKRDLSIQGIQYYLAMLQELRRQTSALLSQPTTLDPTWKVFLAANLIAAIYEVTANKSMKGFENHMQGAAFILEQQGIIDFHDPVDRHVLYDFRSFEFLRCLLHRRYTFLCDSAWREPEWLIERPQGHCAFQVLVTMGLDVLPLLEQFDQITATAGYSPQPVHTQSQKSALLTLLKSSQEVLQRIPGWQNTFELPRCSDPVMSKLTDGCEYARLRNSPLVAELYHTTIIAMLLDLQVEMLLRLEINESQQVEEANRYAQLAYLHNVQLLQQPGVLTEIVYNYVVDILQRRWSRE